MTLHKSDARRPGLQTLFTCLALLTPLLTLACQRDSTAQQAPPVGNSAFEQTWARTDLPVESGETQRTWIWGPAAISDALGEAYVDNAVGRREVLYYDKARMEINDPTADASAAWYVTNGLLVNELITGSVQVGDETFLDHTPAQINVAGDPDDPDALTYATLSGLRDEPARQPGEVIADRVQRDGVVIDDPALAQRGITAAEHVGATGHTVATPFWEFLNAERAIWSDGAFSEGQLFTDPFYATGLPITEAYWTHVLVGGVERDVLVQCFERRCLTYTPDNDAGWQVEAGNVGRHYYDWRYETLRLGPARPFPAALTKLPEATVNGVPLQLEVVSSSEMLRCGLMHRLNLPENQAMLFVFSSDTGSGFWNRNTFVPLTLAWLSADGTIISFTDMAAATPGASQYPTSYPAPGIYRYVIEANQGWFSERGIQMGGVVDVQDAVAKGEATPYPICEVLGY